MEIEIIPAGQDLKSVVMNLALYYIYDFTEILGFKCPPDGLYYTGFIEKYWTEAGRWPFLFRVEGEPAGFALVGREGGSQPDTQYDINQFFIMRKFRGRGLGRAAACGVFDRFRGRWEVREVVQNLPAQAFWRKVIDRYTGGKFRELPEPVKCDEWMDVVQLFDNSR